MRLRPHVADSWDAKITTLPGLYYAAAGSVWLGRTLGFSVSCDTGTLRALNGIIYVLLVWLILHVARQRERGSGKHGNVLTALTAATFPVLFFCGLLYYTDALSVFLVLGSYSLAQPPAGSATVSSPRLAASALVSCCLIGADLHRVVRPATASAINRLLARPSSCHAHCRPALERAVSGKTTSFGRPSLPAMHCCESGQRLLRQKESRRIKMTPACFRPLRRARSVQAIGAGS